MENTNWKLSLSGGEFWGDQGNQNEQRYKFLKVFLHFLQ